MIYSINGESINASYDYSGEEASAYDINGTKVHQFVPKDPYLNNRLLLFEDDFRTKTLNRNNWRPEVGHVRGNQSDFYREQNVTIENNQLVLTAKQENHAGYSWTAGSVTGIGMHSWMFGRFEAKMKCPGVSGNNTAFWCLPNFARQTYPNDEGVREFTTQTEGFYSITEENNWDYCSEIDIVETIPGNTNRPQCNLWDNFWENFGSANFTSDINTQDWHVYAMEWTPEYIAILIDNTEYKRWVFSNYEAERVKVFKEYPQSILLTIGIDNPSLNMKAYIDWVRVYAPANVQNKIVETGIFIQQTLTLKKGYRGYMIPLFTPYNASDQTVVWRSDDESIVSCDHGLIYGIETGTAMIHVISPNNYVSSCVVTVVEP